MWGSAQRSGWRSGRTDRKYRKIYPRTRTRIFSTPAKKSLHKFLEMAVDTLAIDNINEGQFCELPVYLPSHKTLNLTDNFRLRKNHFHHTFNLILLTVYWHFLFIKISREDSFITLVNSKLYQHVHLPPCQCNIVTNVMNDFCFTYLHFSLLSVSLFGFRDKEIHLSLGCQSK